VTRSWSQATRVRPVAALLTIFSTVAALYFHNNLVGQDNSVHFFANMMTTGDLLQMAAFGAGAFSLDEYLGNRRAYSDRVATAP